MKHSPLFKSLILVLLAVILPQLASAYDFKVNGLCYNIISNGTAVQVTCEVEAYPDGCAYPNLSGALTIPSSVYYNGGYYSVTSIGNAAFLGCTSLISVTIPNSVTVIGQNAFLFCNGLNSVTIPNSVTSIGYQAFNGCTGLTSVTIGNSVTSIGPRAFWNCTGLTLLIIPNSVTTIGSWAFKGCTGLKSVTIPNSVKTIDFQAFSHCSGLTSINIPSSVTSIGDEAFYGCSGLTSIIVNSGNTKYDSRNNCNAIIEKATNTLIVGCKNTVIPNSVTSIGSSAFGGCSGLTSITIPNSVTSIGDYVFSGCSGLTSITIPSSVTSIGDRAFSGCSGLISIVVNSGNTKYDSRNNCNAIIEKATNTLIVGCKNTIIPNTVSSIGSRAFSGCSGLTSINIPNYVTSIGDHAFYDCSGLTSITISNSVTSIDNYAFDNCTNLTKVKINDLVAWCNIRFGNIYANPTFYARGIFLNNSLITDLVIPNSVSTIKDYAFNNCKYLTSVTLPNSITSIGKGSFIGCYGLTSVTIPNSVTSIDVDAFYACNNLISLTLSNSLKTIGNYALSRCSKLTSISIPASVTKIGEYAFWQDYGLTSMISWIENPVNVQLGDYCFDEIPDDCLLYVRNNSYYLYKNADVWKNFNIVLFDDIKPTIKKLTHVRGESFVSVTIPFNMNNFDEISGFQFDITLPAGVSIATDNYGDGRVWLNGDRKARNHSIDVSSLSGNTYRVLASSPTNNKFKGNDGEVMYLDLDFAEEHPIGNYNVYISNIRLVAPDETEYIGANSSIAIDYKYLLGDADCDARVDIADYTITALYILNRPTEVFYSDAANVSGDNNITVADLVGITNISLGIREHEYRPAPAITMANEAQESTPLLNASMEGDNIVALSIDNDTPLAGMQLDLKLPQGMTLANATLEGRAAEYQIGTNTIADGSVRLLISSFSDKNIEAGNDAVIKLVLEGNNVNNEMLYITGAQAASRDLRSYELNDISLLVGTTSIDDIGYSYDKLSIYGKGNTIVVNSPSAMLIQVVHVNGMIIPVEIKPGHNTIEVGGHGVYIIKAGNSAYKVRL